MPRSLQVIAYLSFCRIYSFSKSPPEVELNSIQPLTDASLQYRLVCNCSIRRSALIMSPFHISLIQNRPFDISSDKLSYLWSLSTASLLLVACSVYDVSHYTRRWAASRVSSPFHRDLPTLSIPRFSSHPRRSWSF